MSEKEKDVSEESRIAMLTERIAAQQAAAAEREKEKEKDKKKGKGGKGRSPSPKKNRSPSPKPVSDPNDLEAAETAEEKELRLAKEKMRQELVYSVEHDGKRYTCKSKVQFEIGQYCF